MWRDGWKRTTKAGRNCGKLTFHCWQLLFFLPFNYIFDQIKFHKCCQKIIFNENFTFILRSFRSFRSFRFFRSFLFSSECRPPPTKVKPHPCTAITFNSAVPNAGYPAPTVASTYVLLLLLLHMFGCARCVTFEFTDQKRILGLDLIQTCVCFLFVLFFDFTTQKNLATLTTTLKIAMFPMCRKSCRKG